MVASIPHLKRPAGSLLLKSPQDFRPRPPPRHMSSDNFWTTKFAALRYAIAWLGYAWMRLVVRLPFRMQMALGRALGRLAYSLLRERRRIAARNIDTCLPDLPPAARARILAQHFEALGLSIVEMAMGWFGDRTGRARARGCRGRGAPCSRARQRQGRHSVLGTLHDVRVLLAGAAPALHQALRDVQVAAQSRDESR